MRERHAHAQVFHNNGRPGACQPRRTKANQGLGSLSTTYLNLAWSRKYLKGYFALVLVELMTLYPINSLRMRGTHVVGKQKEGVSKK